jgi:hypothetical protein
MSNWKFGQIDPVRMEIIKKDKTTLTLDRDIEFKSFEYSYEQHRLMLKDLVETNKIDKDDVACIKVYLNKERKDQKYFFLEWWNGKDFEGLCL